MPAERSGGQTRLHVTEVAASPRREMPADKLSRGAGFSRSGASRPPHQLDSRGRRDGTVPADRSGGLTLLNVTEAAASPRREMPADEHL